MGLIVLFQTFRYLLPNDARDYWFVLSWIGTSGSAQEFVKTRILGCFLKNDEFGFCDCHALSLQQ